MKALSLRAVHDLALIDAPAPLPNSGEVVIGLRAAALNHRDVWIKAGQYAGLQFPSRLGSDGAGHVLAVGLGVDSAWLGQEVIINPSLGWGDRDGAPASTFGILGLPRDGTFAEQIVVPVEQIAPKPAHLSWEEAAALPLAGLTSFRAVATRARVHQGEKVLVTGIGGGTALYALQIAKALGAEVWVTSSSGEKLKRAIQLGAAGGFLYTDPKWAEAALNQTGGFDAIIDSSAGPGFETLLDVANPGGRIVFFGGTRGVIPQLPPRKVFWKQLSLLGTTMGSPRDWAGLLELVNRTKLRPVVSSIYEFARAPEAFAAMEAGSQFGKLVLRIA